MVVGSEVLDSSRNQMLFTSGTCFDLLSSSDGLWSPCTDWAISLCPPQLLLSRFPLILIPTLFSFWRLRVQCRALGQSFFKPSLQSNFNRAVKFRVWVCLTRIVTMLRNYLFLRGRPLAMYRIACWCSILWSLRTGCSLINSQTTWTAFENLAEWDKDI